MLRFLYRKRHVVARERDANARSGSSTASRMPRPAVPESCGGTNLLGKPVSTFSGSCTVRQRDFPNSLSCRGSLRLSSSDSPTSPQERISRSANGEIWQAVRVISRAQQDDEATVNDKTSRDPIPAAEPDTFSRPVARLRRRVARSERIRLRRRSALPLGHQERRSTGAPMRPTFCSSATSARSAAAAVMRSCWSPTMRRLRSTPSSNPPSATRARA